MSEIRDVLERMERRAGMPEPAFERLLRRGDRRRRNQRIAAAAAGLAVAIAGIGWSLATLVPGGSGGPASSGTKPPTGGGGVVGVVLPTVAIWAALVALGLTVLAIVRLPRRAAARGASHRRTDDPSDALPAAGHGPRTRTRTGSPTGGHEMDSKEKVGLGMPPVTVPGTSRDLLRTARVNRWLVGAVVVLVAAVLALGIALIAQAGEEGTPAVPENRWTETLDQEMAAVTAHDFDAAVEFYGEDAVLVFAEGPGEPEVVYRGADEILDGFEGANTLGDWSFERVGPVIGGGDVAASAMVYHGSGGWEGQSGVNLWWFDAEGKIVAQWSMVAPAPKT